MAARKSRGTLSTHLTNLVGSGKEFIPSQLPRNRGILMFGIYLREKAEADKRNYSESLLVRDIVPALLAQWTKANAEFQFPVLIQKEALCGRVKRLWNDGVKYSEGKGKLKEKKNFGNMMDRLMDLLQCH